MYSDIIQTFSAFRALEANWNKVYMEDPEAQFFLSWKWFEGIFEDHPNACRIIAVKNNPTDEDYVGFFPIRVTTKWSRSKACFLNEVQMGGTLHWGQYHGFICLPEHQIQIITAFAQQLKMLNWERVHLKYFRVSEQRKNLFLAQFNNEEFRISNDKLKMIVNGIDKLVCPFIQLPKDYETYLSSLSANTRQKLRRFNRKLEGSEELQITTPTKNTLSRDLDILGSLWLQKWSTTSGAKNRIQKYKRIIAKAFEKNTLYMPILWKDGEPLGVLASLIDWLKPNMYFLVAGRRVESPDAYIGYLLHSHNIQWAINNRMQTYDFLHGNERYKYSYGCKERRLENIFIKTKSRTNLNDQLDIASFEYMKSKTTRLAQEGNFSEAKAAAQQLERFYLDNHLGTY